MKYEIEPQRDWNKDEFLRQPGAESGETHFSPCDDGAAETFAVFREQVERPSDDRWLLVAEFPSRAEAAAWISAHV